MKLNMYQEFFIATLSILAYALPAETMTAKIKKGDALIYTTSVQLIGLEERASACPKFAMCIQAQSTFAKLNVKLSGCEDRVATVSHNLSVNTQGEPVLSVSVTAVANKASQVSKCIVAPNENIGIDMGTDILNWNLFKIKDLNN